jgi:hypothetical protein
MRVPGFTAEHSLGESSQYRHDFGGRTPAGWTVHPAFSPVVGAHCAPQFGWVWAVCGHVGIVPIYCKEVTFLGWSCS